MRKNRFQIYFQLGESSWQVPVYVLSGSPQLSIYFFLVRISGYLFYRYRKHLKLEGKDRTANLRLGNVKFKSLLLKSPSLWYSVPGSCSIHDRFQPNSQLYTFRNSLNLQLLSKWIRLAKGIFYFG